MKKDYGKKIRRGKWAAESDQPRTVKDWLQDMAKTNQSSELDGKKMQHLLRKIGFNNAVVTYGVIYPEGRGRPVDIHTMAREILSIESGKKKEGTWAKRDKSLYWTSEWDGEPKESMKVHQLVKNGSIVAYVKQYPREKIGSEYAVIHGRFMPVIASKGTSVSSIKRGLKKWAMGKNKISVIRD